MSLTVVIIMVTFTVIFRKEIAKIPGAIVGAIDYINHLPAKRLAIIILVIAGIIIMLKGRRK